MKNIIITVLMLLCYFTVYSQRTCGSELNISDLQFKNLLRYQRAMSLENKTREISNIVNSNIPTSTIIIPVVVHVLYNNSNQNISDTQINSQIQVLNEDFRRINADKTNTPIAFANIAGDANIEFRLAKIDPNGNVTNGITRTQTSIMGFSQLTENMKYNSTGGYDAWNTQHYLNIWVCNITTPTGLLGYAQFPFDLYNERNFGNGDFRFEYKETKFIFCRLCSLAD